MRFLSPAQGSGSYSLDATVLTRLAYRSALPSTLRHLELGRHLDRLDFLMCHPLVSGVWIAIHTQALSQAKATNLHALRDLRSQLEAIA
jgi:hypothetical protein